MDWVATNVGEITFKNASWLGDQDFFGLLHSFVNQKQMQTTGVQASATRAVLNTALKSEVAGGGCGAGPPPALQTEVKCRRYGLPGERGRAPHCKADSRALRKANMSCKGAPTPPRNLLPFPCWRPRRSIDHGKAGGQTVLRSASLPRLRCVRLAVRSPNSSS